MRIVMVRKLEVEIGDCPLDVFKKAVEDNDANVVNDVERMGFDEAGEIVVYSIISSETEVTPATVASAVQDGL